jgi:hypothetical protein
MVVGTIQEQIEANVANYIIWNPKSTQPPKAVQPNRPQAIRIAGKMAAESPGEEFYVCKLVSRAVKPKPLPQPERAVQYTDLEKDS